VPPPAASGARVVVLAAHADDETLGASALLARARGAAVLHLTDGAPRDPAFRAPAFRDSAAGYARARRVEAVGALSLAGVGSERIASLGAVDQEAALALEPLARALARLLVRLRPARLVTHAYEGGHPDHDAAALVARAACSLLARSGRPAPRLYEMALYHGAPGRLVTFEFLPGCTARVLTRRLGPADRRLKEEMLACYASQREVLAWFPPPEVERLRRAPAADFARAPHEGPLWYERMGFAMTAARWRALAARALDALDRERLGR
jgi:LmbE family N-acetylglucosaminyl deacetylase